MKSEEKIDLKLSEAERLVINRYRKAKQLAEEFLAENHGSTADAQFTAVVRAFMDVIEGVRVVHRLDRLVAPPKQGRSNMYVN